MNQGDNFTSSENKGMIWSLLQESNIFVGIENDKFTNIQSIFENTIKNKHLILPSYPCSHR